uniref:Elongation of very long chain fatty acids protein n=1 Tax=Rhabditophanes sp. KR3021 TaxID=114890 RepID=A0AC35TP26_9BILA
MRDRRTHRKALNGAIQICNGANFIVYSGIVSALLKDFLSHFMRGPYNLICVEDDYYTNSNTAGAVTLFTISKSWLLLDTFIVLAKKKKVNVGSIAHHAIVVLQVAITYKSGGSLARFPIFVNSVILMMSYWYYIALSFKWNVRRLKTKIILAQKMQFLAVIVLMLMARSYASKGDVNCQFSTIGFNFNLIAYLIFLVLSFKRG